MKTAGKQVVGVDIAKSVFQVYTVDKGTGEVFNKAIKRAKFLEWFANREPCLIGMEACGGSQHWARQLQGMGHEVKLLAGKMVKAFVCGNKNDAQDAHAIFLAVQQPSVKAVAVKTEGQQAILALHRIRESLVKARTATINALRGLLAEYGEVFGKGRKSFDEGMKEALERLAERLPAPVIDALRAQWNEVARLDERMANIERSLQAWMREDPAAKAIADIPGVGLITATAAVATMGDPKAFRSGREFAAYVGLVPGQTGSGGKVKILGMSKRGDTYLRKMIINGARSVVEHSKTPGPWLQQLSERRPFNVVVVAVANKIARTIWAMLAHGRKYDREYVSSMPQAATTR